MNKTALIVCGTVIGAAAVCYGAYHYSQQIIPREKRNLINSVLGNDYAVMGQDEDEEEAQGNVDVVVFNFDKDNRLLERAGRLNQKTLIITFARNTQQIQLDNSCKPVKYNEVNDQYIKFRDMYIVRRAQQLKLKKTLLLKQTTDDLRQVGLTNETKVSV
ncbi:MAG: hypothetical protein EBU01_14340, partial [Crocinitomicaceae bacterium]|nr:hypothetical protein [Crocinitomicaceae bacterium]